ncbi:hypothetical protein TNIN_481971 [Trichonephila inaurata madagascariensis]|uniref:Uncharacterized protein n=1 Tax=Trichonephila inaurata madagascariensis TaxID=2747483 RepID=A0A8X6Y0I8_9ARAC|nr:hypothetical protein TNIN_481971 [Trichonephila inaurata madagascariensis]
MQIIIFRQRLPGDEVGDTNLSSPRERKATLPRTGGSDIPCLSQHHHPVGTPSRIFAAPLVKRRRGVKGRILPPFSWPSPLTR